MRRIKIVVEIIAEVPDSVEDRKLGHMAVELEKSSVIIFDDSYVHRNHYIEGAKVTRYETISSDLDD